MNITPELLSELYDYDASTGFFTYKPRQLRFFSPSSKKTAFENYTSWNSRYPGVRTMNTKHSKGYLVGNVFGKTIYAHRAAWAIYHGKWPSRQIDHINRDRTDNRIENLRDIKSAQNQRNLGKSIVNSSGYTGVTWNCASKLWQAQIGYRGKRINLGLFVDPRDAAIARLGAQRALGFSPTHGGLADDV